MKYFLPRTCNKCPTAQLVHNHNYCSLLSSAQLLTDSNIYYSQGYRANRKNHNWKNRQISRTCTLFFFLAKRPASYPVRDWIRAPRIPLKLKSTFPKSILLHEYLFLIRNNFPLDLSNIKHSNNT